MSLLIEQLNPHACLTYLVKNQDSHEATLIDPILDHVEDYLQLLKKQKLNLTHVIDTHTHADHISGAAAIKDRTDCEYIMQENAPARCVTIRVRDGDEIDLIGTKFKFIHTPGHTKDSVTLVLPDRVFTGDTLFLDEGGAGRDDLPGGDPAEHYDSLQKLMKLPDHYDVYPAHEYRGRKPSNIAKQKISNPHLKPRSREEFIEYLEDLKLGPADWMHDVLKANYHCARDPGSVWIPVDSPACEVKGTLDLGVNAQVISSINVQEFRTRMDNKKIQIPVLIDVRENRELRGPLGHLQGIKHIPLGQLISSLDELKNLKDQEIIIICRSGARAHTAAQIMQKKGFSKAFVLEGGMKAWRKIVPI